MTRSLSLWLLVMGIVWGNFGPAGRPTAAAQTCDFRVDNAVYLDNEHQPRVESTTIFAGGLVYDYLKTPAEVTVFDPGQGRFVLLDIGRRVRTEVDLVKVQALCERLQTWAAKQSDPLWNFLAHPSFDEQWQEASGGLVFRSPLVHYELTTTAAPSPALLAQYRQFSDAYGQLNVLLNPGSRPPFARMVINAALERRQRFAPEVQLTVQVGSGLSAKRMVVRSQHHLVTSLVEADRDRVAQTGQYRTIFSPVPFDEYQKKVAD